MLVGDSHADGDTRCRDRDTDAGAHANGDPCCGDRHTHANVGADADAHRCDRDANVDTEAETHTHANPHTTAGRDVFAEPYANTDPDVSTCNPHPS